MERLNHASIWQPIPDSGHRRHPAGGASSVPSPAARAAGMEDWRGETSRTEIALDAVGDGDFTSVIAYGDEASYRRTKAADTDAAAARRFERANPRALTRVAAVAHDDGERAITATGRQFGCASLRRDAWEIPLDAPYRLLHAGGRVAIFVHTAFGPAGRLTTAFLQ